MSRRIPILLFSLLVIAILTVAMTIVASADDGRGHGGGPGGNGPGGGKPPSDNQTWQGPAFGNRPFGDNVTGHGAPPSDNVTDNFTMHGLPPTADNMADNFTMHRPPSLTDNITDNFTGRGPRFLDATDNFTATLLQSVAGILNIDKQTLVDAFNQALQLNSPSSDNVTDNFTAQGPPSMGGIPPSDNISDNFSGQGPQPPGGFASSDNMSDNFTGHGHFNWDTSDNFTDTLLQSMAGILNIDKQTLVDAFNQALQLNK